MRALRLLPALLIPLVALSAHAVDGVLEINQACADNLGSGCFPGDSPGFPVEITLPGSYRLTSNLTPGTGLTDAIALNSGAILLDLNSFSIAGGTTCTETGTVPNVISCVLGGNFTNGISGTALGGVAIRNGAIFGMRNSAISLGSTTGVAITEVGTSQNGGRCIETGAGGALKSVIVGVCDSDGILLGEESYVIEVRSVANNGNGLQVGRGSRVENSQLAKNVLDGVLAGDDSLVVDSTSNSNGGDGIDIGANSMVLRNTVTGNTVAGAVGVRAGATTGFGRNALGGNTGFFAGGVTLLDNVCGLATC